jgi:hypothetical protein
MEKSVKRLKKEKSMFNNLETFLKGMENTTANKVQITWEPKGEKEKEDFHPEFIIVGTHQKRNFQMKISDTELKPNNDYLCLLIMELTPAIKEVKAIKANPSKKIEKVEAVKAVEGTYITFKPYNNAQMKLMINQFNPNGNFTTIPEKPKAEVIEEPKAEETKQAKEK